MNHMEQSLEGKLAQESRGRELDHYHQKGDINALLAAAHLLNTAFSQQHTINRWLAHEAAENLGEAWQTKKEAQDCYAEFVRSQNHANH